MYFKENIHDKGNVFPNLHIIYLSRRKIFILFKIHYLLESSLKLKDV